MPKDTVSYGLVADSNDPLIEAFYRLYGTAMRKRASYSPTQHWANFDFVAQYLGVPNYKVTDALELLKLSRIRELGADSTEPLEDQMRDKALYAILSYAMFLNSYEGGDIGSSTDSP